MEFTLNKLDHETGLAEVTLSVAALRMINNALNEVCNGLLIGDFEFSTRLGQEREEARRLLDRVNEAIPEAPDFQAGP